MGLRSQKVSLRGGLFVLISGSLLLLAGAVITRGDRDWVYSQVAPVSASGAGLTSERISERLDDVSTWPRWFRLVNKVTPLEGGAVLLLSIVPPRSKPFEVTVRVEKYRPGHDLRLRLETDSSGKIKRLFDPLFWEIEIFSDKVETRIIVHPISWRSRLIAGLGERTRQAMLAGMLWPEAAALASK